MFRRVCGKGEMNIVLDVYALPFEILILMFKTFRTCPFCRIFSDVAEDLTVSVDGQSFLLHKVPFQ